MTDFGEVDGVETTDSDVSFGYSALCGSTRVAIEFPLVEGSWKANLDRVDHIVVVDGDGREVALTVSGTQFQQKSQEDSANVDRELIVADIARAVIQIDERYGNPDSARVEKAVQSFLDDPTLVLRTGLDQMHDRTDSQTMDDFSR